MAADFVPHVSFRDGRAVASEGRKTPAAALTRFDTLVLLIHGFNNDQPGASRAYTAFHKLQSQLGPLSANLVGVFWPGDNWSGPLFYMRSIRQAEETAAVLGEELRRAARARGFLRIDIVTHSMGARLSLKLLEELLNRTEPSLVIRRLAFMAAAVPVFMLEPPDPPNRRPFRTALEQSIDSVLNLFSPNDRVLGVAFPLGQSLARGPEGVFPIALGHREWKGPGALTTPRLRQRQISGAGHSDYWGSKADGLVQAEQANREVRSFLSLGALLPRRMEARSMSVRAAGETRETTAGRAIAGRLAFA